MNPQFAFDKKQGNILANLRKGDKVVLICTGKGDIAKIPMSDSCMLLDEVSTVKDSEAPAVPAPPRSSCGPRKPEL